MPSPPDIYWRVLGFQPGSIVTVTTISYFPSYSQIAAAERAKAAADKVWQRFAKRAVPPTPPGQWPPWPVA